MATEIASKNSILTAEAALRKIRRMAFEVAEQNTGEQELILLGIEGNGTIVAAQLLAELRSITCINIRSGTILINKKDPQHARLQTEEDLQNRVVLVADDVANTGRTMLYALRPLLNQYPRKIQTLVLVERSHKLFAVQPDFVGLSVSTTMQEHITVETDGSVVTGAYLF